jgi:hypothetical protein
VIFQRELLKLPRGTPGRESFSRRATVRSVPHQRPPNGGAQGWRRPAAGRIQRDLTSKHIDFTYVHLVGGLEHEFYFSICWE